MAEKDTKTLQKGLSRKARTLKRKGDKMTSIKTVMRRKNLGGAGG